MPTNLVRSHRYARGLTQRGLAQLVGTTHQRVQAIESSGTSVRLDLALRICAALGQPVEVVFPAQVSCGGLLPSDHRVETLRCRMRGGQTLDIGMDVDETGRVWRALQSVSGSGFVLIDSVDGCRYAINPQHLLAWKWVWDRRPGWVDAPHWHAPLTGVRIFLVDGGAPLEYDVPEDEPDVAQERVGQLWDLFTFLQDPEEETRSMGRQGFVDRDGEPVFFHKADTAIVAAPLVLIGSEEGMPWDSAPALSPSVPILRFPIWNREGT